MPYGNWVLRSEGRVLYWRHPLEPRLSCDDSAAVSGGEEYGLMRPLHSSLTGAALVGLIIDVVVCSAQPPEAGAPDAFPTLQGRYFGEALPGARPQIFLPGVISTTDFDGCVACLLDGRLCVFSSATRGTLFSYEQDGRWTSPQPAPWQNQEGVTDFTAGQNGRTIFFQTSRPTSVDDGRRESNTWVVEWTGDAWAEPRPLPSPPNSEEFYEAYPSVSADGTLYFFSSSRDAARVGEIFRSALSDGAYGPAEQLPDPVNSFYHEVDPVIAPDGSYLLFGSGRPGGFTVLDLYVCFRRDDGRWTSPINGGQMFNSFGQPIRMNITPDGKYLFFPSAHETDRPKGEPIVSHIARRWGDWDVYWVSTGFVDELESQVMTRRSAAEVIIREYRMQGLQAAVARMETLLAEPSDTHYLELSELLIFCGELIGAGRLEETDELVEALVGSTGEVLRIRQGYAIACILNGQTAKGLQLLRSLWTLFPTAPSRSDTELYFLTYQLGRRGHEEDELTVLRFITEEFPGSDGAWLDLARAYERRGEIESSRAACAEALEVNPDNTDAAALLEQLARRKPAG